MNISVSHKTTSGREIGVLLCLCNSISFNYGFVCILMLLYHLVRIIVLIEGYFWYLLCIFLLQGIFTQLLYVPESPRVSHSIAGCL